MSRSVLFRFLLVFARGAQIHRGYATMTPGRQISRRKTKVLLVIRHLGHARGFGRAYLDR
jgi:hypothetical protein